MSTQDNPEAQPANGPPLTQAEQIIAQASTEQPDPSHEATPEAPKLTYEELENKYKHSSTEGKRLNDLKKKLEAELDTINQELSTTKKTLEEVDPFIQELTHNPDFFNHVKAYYDPNRIPGQGDDDLFDDTPSQPAQVQQPDFDALIEQKLQEKLQEKEKLTQQQQAKKQIDDYLASHPEASYDDVAGAIKQIQSHQWSIDEIMTLAANGVNTVKVAPKVNTNSTPASATYRPAPSLASATNSSKPAKSKEDALLDSLTSFQATTRFGLPR